MPYYPKSCFCPVDEKDPFIVLHDNNCPKKPKGNFTPSLSELEKKAMEEFEKFYLESSGYDAPLLGVKNMGKDETFEDLSPIKDFLSKKLQEAFRAGASSKEREMIAKLKAVLLMDERFNDKFTGVQVAELIAHLTQPK